ncbi:protein-disulfide reductase DsbD family protein [Nisaea acidiphila]|uniref:Protein-disulfide reductase DsbD family protein n=1 Tax=Nisaea acidiphila TaxID=1862145 RepID=A0A9J7AX44_9PROT|nr:protein-disulfide reductase DsbD domain-containing protein [Nisaea acidiphila]UUX51943.1 protein-disulfide reductase DsbD family protein [Nisaea acidiphila]
MIWTLRPAFPTLLLLLGLFAAGAGAVRDASAAPGASDWVSTDFADVRLVSAVSGTEGRETVPLGLQFRLAEGWKVYWRAPGDAGFPPEIAWQGSENLSAAEWQWPVPERFSLFGLETYGYHDEVVIPIGAVLSKPGAALSLKADMNALACSDICVPLNAKLALDLEGGAAEPTAFAQLIDRYRARVPRDMSGLGLDIASVSAVGAPEPHSLRIEVRSSVPLEALDVFPEARAGFSFGKPEVELSPDRLSAVLIVPAGVPEGGRLSGEAVTLTLVDGDRFLERALIVSEADGNADAGRWAALSAILSIAFLGGLILNLMPCVLPVLSLKVVGAIKYGGADKGAIRTGFLASAAGIVASFLLLAGGAIALKEAGLAVGWGIQFQQPLFLAVMIAILVLFAGNLAGLFEIALPRRLADLGLAGGDAGRGRLTSHFLTGAFATLLATPCSAPFLGTAVGFALSRGAAEILTVFAVMGLGLAAPYLLVAAIPGLARALPKPGPWMVWLRRILALALLATALWLFSVFAASAEPVRALLLAVLALVLTGALVWRARRGGAQHRAAGLLAAFSMLAVIGVGLQATARDGGAAPETESAVNWQTFDRREIARLVAAEKTVLIDVTADWCLTCKVNKSLVLDGSEITARIASGDIVAMRADWTTPDPAIAEYLASFGRYGIPFNAVYGPAAPSGVVLPELLSLEAVEAAIREARG